METREAILHAAHRLYLEEGLAGLSMRKVAREVGISATAIYRHFEDKEAMLFHVVAEGSHLFLEYLSRGLKGRSPEERLRLTGEGYLQFALEHASYYRIMFMAPKEHVGLVRLNERAAESFAPTFTFLVDRVRECIEAKALAPGNAEEVSAMIWANCHGLCALRLTDHLHTQSEAEFRSFYRRATDTFRKGLA